MALYNHIILLMFFAIGGRGLGADHPQSKLFGDQQTEVATAPADGARLVAVNPTLAGHSFGTFVVPSVMDAVSETGAHYQSLMDAAAIETATTQGGSIQFVPPETARAVLLPPSDHPHFRDILVKGTGPIQKFIKDNQLRPEGRNFNGLLELSEAERDMVNSQMLIQAGIFAVVPIAIIDRGILGNFGDFEERAANYVRGFRVQTRLSNLVTLAPEYRQRAIDDAIQQLAKLGVNDGVPMSYFDYFFYMTRQLARTAAIYQAVGYTQDSLHYGQVTLAGETVDFGIGSWEKPKTKGVINALTKYFRYERQPILFANMLFKTHSVTAEPEPIRLGPESKSVISQKTLFGMIQSFAPTTALAIAAADPERAFWTTYDSAFAGFDYQSYVRRAAGLRKSLFDFDSVLASRKLSTSESRKLLDEHRRLIAEAMKDYQVQVGPWERPGLSALHQGTLLARAARNIGVSLERLDFSQAEMPWKEAALDYVKPYRSNLLTDLSFRPADVQGGGGPFPCLSIRGRYP